jgi:hypothetical protein
MVASDRVTFLADRPLTAVPAYRASKAERAMACSSGEVRTILVQVCQAAHQGDRATLADLYRLIHDRDTVNLSTSSTQFLAEEVQSRARAGHLLIVPGWYGFRDYLKGVLVQENEPSNSDDRVIRRAMAGEEHIAFEGFAFLLVPANAWKRVRETGRYHVVRKDEAAGILRRLAAHSASSERKKALEDASGRLAHTHVRLTDKGILLGRRAPVATGTSAPVSAPAVTPSRLASAHAAPGPTTGHLIVRMRTPLGTGIPGITVEIAGLSHQTTGGDGRADFGIVAPGAYSVRAHKAGYGPVPAGGGYFAVGEATGTQSVAAGATATLDLQMVTVTSVTVRHTPVVAATPARIYKRAPGDIHVEHVITCTALCPRTAGTGAGTQIPVRVDWTFTPGGGNAPKAKGGKDNTDVHFGSAPGFYALGAGTTTVATVSTDAGETNVTFRASVTSGDRFTVHARVLVDPANPAAGDLGHADSPDFEVWKRLDYNNLYRMQTGPDLGFDLASRCTPANIQPAFTPTFTEYTVGAPHPIAFCEYITNLIPPKLAQLPTGGAVRIRSNGADTRVVTVHGLVVAAGGATSPRVEVLTLTGTANVVGTKMFQKVTSVAVPPSPARTVIVETAAGAAISAIPPHLPAVAPNFLFDTVASVQSKAQAWYDANQTQLDTDLAALGTSIGAPGYFLVGASYYHPKMDGRPATGHTNYYAGYPTVKIVYYSEHFHPDAKWGSVDGVNLGQMSCLFLNVGGGSYASMVARHEIGHASDHVSYGPGDHCPQRTCLMYAFSQKNQFCTIGADHSVNRTKGWSP